MTAVLDGHSAVGLITKAQLSGGRSWLARLEDGQLAVYVEFDGKQRMRDFVSVAGFADYEHQPSDIAPQARWRVVVES